MIRLQIIAFYPNCELFNKWIIFYDLFRFDAVEKIEDALTGLKVIEINKNSIKLSLTTYAPYLENLFSQLKIEDVIHPYEQTYELLVELVDGTMELKNAEV